MSPQGRQECSRPAADYRAKVERGLPADERGTGVRQELRQYVGVVQETPGGFLLAWRVCLMI
jgi:hypothetical protein